MSLRDAQIDVAAGPRRPPRGVAPAIRLEDRCRANAGGIGRIGHGDDPPSLGIQDVGGRESWRMYGSETPSVVVRFRA